MVEMTSMNRRKTVNVFVVFFATAIFFGGLQSVCMASEWEWTRGSGWTEGAGRARSTPAEQLRHAYALERKGEFHDAAKQYFLLIRIYPDSSEAGIGLQRLAKCLFEMEDFYRSFKAIEQVIRTYPRSGRMADLVAIEYKIGRKLATGKHARLLAKGDALKAGRKEALEVFAAVLKHDPYGPFADNALLASGDIHLDLQEPVKAKRQFEKLIREFPESPLQDRARLGITRCDVMTGKATSSQVDRAVKEMRAKGKLKSRQDEEEISRVEDNLNQLEEVEAKKMWDASQVYFRRGNTRSVKAGVFLLRELVRRYPKTTYASQARRLLPQIVIPKKGGRFRLPKIYLNPFRKPKPPPSFETPQITSDEIRGEVVTDPIPGIVASPGESMAGVEPRGESTSYPRGNGRDDGAAAGSAVESRPGSAAGVLLPEPPPAPQPGRNPDKTGKTGDGGGRWQVKVDNDDDAPQPGGDLPLPHPAGASVHTRSPAAARSSKVDDFAKTGHGEGDLQQQSFAGVMPRGAAAGTGKRQPVVTKPDPGAGESPELKPEPVVRRVATPPVPVATEPAGKAAALPVQPQRKKKARVTSGWQLSNDFD